MVKHFNSDPVAEPDSHEPGERGPDSSLPELDWRGVIERVREEFRSGRAPEGVQRTFR
jgi:hypothetical protein